ncbi:M20 family metallopeptidase [Ascidiimonas sp. W6]|uniref:M20 family metallopeptidase n=1 Tax=Ascidiimonas meishanensis TaxID=3128903 RepID=UPI0030EFA53E
MKDFTTTVNDIQGFLTLKKPEMESFLKILVSLESPSHKKALQQKILRILANELEKTGLFVSYKAGKKTGGYLYARPQNRTKYKPLQLLVGHCDTVWPEKTLLEMPWKKKHDRISGPGIYDMKAGLTQIVFALKAIKELNISLQVTPIILINSDEEIGSKESTVIIKRLARISNRAYILEPPLGLEGRLKTARKGIGRFTVSVKGKAAHAGLDPAKGVNAIVELSYQIQKLHEMNNLDRGISVNIGIIEGGISPNVVAPVSKAVVDVRVLTEKDGIQIANKILNLKPYLPDVELHVDGAIGRPPMEKTPANQMLWEIAESQGWLLGLELQEATAGGGSDGNTTSLYTATLDGLGTPGDGAHASHEFIKRNKLVERTALLTLLLMQKPLNVMS